MASSWSRRPAAPDEAHLRVRLTFTDGGPELRFVDQRTFGGLARGRPGRRRTGAGGPHRAATRSTRPSTRRPGSRALRRRRTGLKRALLDQTLASGIGNIYADEALWRARLHWARATDTLPRAKAREVLAAARSVMVAALAEGGTSFDSLYVNVNGESG